MNEMNMPCSNIKAKQGLAGELQHFEDMLKGIISDLKTVNIVMTGDTTNEAMFNEPTCVRDSIENINRELELCLSLAHAIKEEF